MGFIMPWIRSSFFFLLVVHTSLVILILQYKVDSFASTKNKNKTRLVQQFFLRYSKFEVCDTSSNQKFLETKF